jgi:uncharacterized membrane protein
MNLAVFFAICLGLIGGLTLAVPSLSKARFFFGVRVGEPFRKTEPGRKALRIYYAHDITGLAITIALALVLGLNHRAAWLLVSILPEAAAGLGYYRANRRVQAYAAPPAEPGVREAELFAEEDRLPRWTLWAIPSFLLPAAGAAYVRAHWNEIPARFASHYGFDGRPNGWTTRTPLHLYGLFLFAVGLMLLIGAMGIVGYYGSRRSAGRRVALRIMISMMYLMGIVFSGAGVWMAHHFPAWILISIVPPYLAGLLYWEYRRGTDLAPAVESTPDECWSLGDVYNNPDDPALFVAKRLGWGYTINFGNPQAKWVAGGFFGGIGALVVLLFWMMR